MSSTHVDPAVAAAQAEVERNREQLAQTVDHLQQNIEAKKRPAAIVAAVALTLGVAVLVWRKRR
ncbi:hypothetical protein [Nocardioides iriomotensis]|jgi:hypothetical protein|uniref:DUF3618 domain-containing protein n=1 Tax=Nocardioides iriomotensis TaxID=715784 RepID=A0A4Q5J7W2_9ACTN|nr:hypothetical protein [Nocardioides iriomotensis]RYU13889.1 hypothetical protein ETU37_05020 [Nocardioides iriomotensis]